jgi:hypothetical protein
MYRCSLMAARLNPDLDASKVFSADEFADADMFIRLALEDETPIARNDSQAGEEDLSELPDLRMRGRRGCRSGLPCRSSPDQQFDAYLAETVAPRMVPTDTSEVTAVTDYWLQKRAQWPELANFALKLLSRPVTSAATERHFSLTGRILNLRRIRLLPAHVNELAMIMANQKASGKVILESKTATHDPRP